MLFDYLIVSSLEKQRIEQDKLCLYLGEWCFNFSEIPNNKKSIVLNYHWNDRQKLYDDFSYLDNLYESVLPKVAHALNNYHQKDYPIEYWRVVIGPWLIYFIQIIFDRWFMLDLAIKKYRPKHCILLESEPNKFVPSDFNDFNDFMQNDQWNEEIIRQIIFFYRDDIKIINSKKDPKIIKRYSHGEKSLKRTFFEKLANFIFSVISVFNSNDKYFFYKPYLKKNYLILSLLLKQIPKFWIKREIDVSDIKLSRKKFRIDINATNKFESILEKIISNNIPIAYLEGFNSIFDSLKDVRWPKNPNKIITSASIWNDDFFKIWAACKRLEGAKLIIYQHGGLYGTTKFNSVEDHEIKIADEFLSWGWIDKRNNNVRPVGNYLFRDKIKHSNKGFGLLVQQSYPRMSYVLYSVVISSQWLNYHKDQIKFFDSLPKKIQSDFVVRLYPHDQGWQQQERWKHFHPDVRIDNAQEKISEKIKNCRIYISTYNATTFLESMSFNVPTLIFWDPYFWELSYDAEVNFKKLEDVGIFHKSPQAAAKMVEKVWGDVDSWWYSEKVQEAKDNFLEIYANKSTPLSYLAKIVSS